MKYILGNRDVHCYNRSLDFFHPRKASNCASRRQWDPMNNKVGFEYDIMES